MSNATMWPSGAPGSLRRHLWWRRIAIGLVLALGVLALLAFARAVPPIVTTADLAVVELYAELATQGRLLPGPYSRFGWHHPGPLYFILTGSGGSDQKVSTRPTRNSG
jgi:hypothetical protein